MTLADKQYKDKNYKTALENYKKSANIISNVNIENKITEIQNIIAKEEQIAKQKNAERKRELAKIEPAIKQSFYKIEFWGDSNTKIYDFYVEPYLWYQWNYDVKEGAFKLAVLYAKLKTNEQYSNDSYLIGTKIRSFADKSILAKYSAFKGIEVK